MQTKKRSVPVWLFWAMAVLAMAIGAYALAFYGDPGGVRRQPFVTDKGALPDLWYRMLWVHAVSAGTGLAIGWLQFGRNIRRNMPNVHRAIGYVYAAAIAAGGVTGLYLACYANGGWVSQLGFGLLSALWLYTLGRGLHSIIYERDPAAHGRWMTRNFALSCAAISLRIYTPLADSLFGLTDTNDTFPVIAWLCWVPNLLFAQWAIGRRRSAATAAATSRTSGRVLH
ncbi:DUF2306 domain-containing protein [Paenibacillus cymbidii]|uniref:DUF2306 domain-containing protein n=1 Tax=Paenibacillus cymbidii TaxID=1639034 RepID=UPI001436757E|nr:DUF2306 domain-containing protein [Paenibacillus cymbidii]